MDGAVAGLILVCILRFICWFAGNGNACCVVRYEESRAHLQAEHWRGHAHVPFRVPLDLSLELYGRNVVWQASSSMFF